MYKVQQMVQQNNRFTQVLLLQKKKWGTALVVIVIRECWMHVFVMKSQQGHEQHDLV